MTNPNGQRMDTSIPASSSFSINTLSPWRKRQSQLGQLIKTFCVRIEKLYGFYWNQMLVSLTFSSLIVPVSQEDNSVPCLSGCIWMKHWYVKPKQKWAVVWCFFLHQRNKPGEPHPCFTKNSFRRPGVQQKLFLRFWQHLVWGQGPTLFLDLTGASYPVEGEMSLDEQAASDQFEFGFVFWLKLRSAVSCACLILQVPECIESSFVSFRCPCRNPPCD